jgi:hypothetical protein
MCGLKSKVIVIFIASIESIAYTAISEKERKKSVITGKEELLLRPRGTLFRKL